MLLSVGDWRLRVKRCQKYGIKEYLNEKFQVVKKVSSISWYMFQGQNQQMKMLTSSLTLRSFKF